MLREFLGLIYPVMVSMSGSSQARYQKIEYLPFARFENHLLGAAFQQIAAIEKRLRLHQDQDHKPVPASESVPVTPVRAQELQWRCSDSISIWQHHSGSTIAAVLGSVVYLPVAAGRVLPERLGKLLIAFFESF